MIQRSVNTGRDRALLRRKHVKDINVGCITARLVVMLVMS